MSERHPYEIARERLSMHLGGTVATGRIQAIAESVVDAIEAEAGRAVQDGLDVESVRILLIRAYIRGHSNGRHSNAPPNPTACVDELLPLADEGAAPPLHDPVGEADG